MKGTSLEELAAFAKAMRHNCVPLRPKVSAELIAGGYAPETPAAIVYKATWPDQKILRCTVGTLGETVRGNGLTKTALITIGDFLGRDYERSKLYDPGFTTEYRVAER